tara:strand:- start:1971 stop:2165 length:195 start_codon:yes stop_codon:yes gene_type:complete
MYDVPYYPGVFETLEDDDMMVDEQVAGQPDAGGPEGGASDAEDQPRPAEEELPAPEQLTKWVRS